uniref:Uncharacterized protein n=1 Tax=Lepeophtheirus salmonis TaxID=72036 RepID=A0A0K2TXF8_LEPSM
MIRIDLINFWVFLQIDRKRFPLYWLPKGQGVQNSLKELDLPWVKSNYPEGNYVFQQTLPWSIRSGPCSNDPRKYFSQFLETHFVASLLSRRESSRYYGIWFYIENRACTVAHPRGDALKTSA